MSVNANDFKGYDVVTDKGTFEFVSKPYRMQSIIQIRLQY